MRYSSLIKGVKNQVSCPLFKACSATWRLVSPWKKIWSAWFSWGPSTRHHHWQKGISCHFSWFRHFIQKIPKVSESGIKINHLENPEMKLSGDSTKIPSLNYYNVTMSVTNHLPASSLVVFWAMPSVPLHLGLLLSAPYWRCEASHLAPRCPAVGKPDTAGSRSSVGSTWIFPRESSTMERSPLCSATPTSVSKSNLQTVEIEHPRWLWSTNQQSNKIQLNF